MDILRRELIEKMTVQTLIDFRTCPICDKEPEQIGLVTGASDQFEKRLWCFEHGLVTLIYFIVSGDIAYIRGSTG